MFHRAWLILLVLPVACGAPYVEPVVGDSPAMVETIRKSWKLDDDFKAAEVLALRFAELYRKGDFKAAWELLDPQWRAHFEAASNTCGLKPDLLFQKAMAPAPDCSPGSWDPADAVVGPHLQHFSPPPEEMEIRSPKGRIPVYAIQDNGTYRFFTVLSRGEKQYIEPALTLNPKKQD